MKKFFIGILVLALSCMSAQARKVRGTVRCGAEPLSGVVVTDGYGFAMTRKSGKFVLEVSDEAEFVYIVTPAGHVAREFDTFF